MRRLLQSIGIVTIAILLWAAGTAADELADPVVILTDDGKAVGELSAERNYIPFNALRGDARMGVTTQAEIFVALGKKLCSSSDGERTWTSRDLPDGRVVWIYTHRCGKARVSSDDGETWSEVRYRVRRLVDPGHGTYATNAVLRRACRRHNS